MNLQVGDVLLTRRLTGYQKVGSFLIAWWLHSNWSHVMPVLDNNKVLNITWPKPKLLDASHFLSGDYRVKVLRPVENLTGVDKAKWNLMATGLLERRYDLKSFAGFLLNDPGLQSKKRVNCAEGTLLCHKAINRLMEYDGRLVSPQTFDDFAYGGLYTVVYES